jgi:hypothetical protein
MLLICEAGQPARTRMLPIRIRLLGGTLKIKRHHHLRTQERGGWVPVWQFGVLYFIWHKRTRDR